MQTTDASEAIAATGFDFVMYLVAEMPRARAFYEAVLGLVPGELAFDQYVEYALPDGNTFAIGIAPEGRHSVGGGVMFAVPDVDAAVARVTAHGGTFIEKFGGTVCDAGWCSDPDGNTFGVHKRYAGR
jgi:predicted enzyme related to lactoylglutathione lyase